MEPPHEKQYSEYSVEINSRAYMTMRDYRNLTWKNQQPWEINPNPPRSMRDYRNQWMSALIYSVPSTYAPPVSPHFTSTPQPPQPPTPSPIEQAILNLSKIVYNFIEEQRAVTVQANQETDTVESSLNKELDGFQSEIDQKLDILQESISKLTNKLVHQEEKNPEGGLTDTMVEEPCLQQPLVENFESSDNGAAVCPWEKKEETSLMLAEEGSGKEEIEKPQKSTAQAMKCPLPTNQVYILPTPATNSKPAAPAPKAKSNPSLLSMQKFKKLVANAQAFGTTSKTQAVAYIAWHSGWFGCRFGVGAPEPRHF